MANKQTVGELVYKISGDMDNLKVELAKSEAQVKKLGASMENTGKTTSSFADGFKKVATGLGLAFLAKLAFDFGKASVQAFANAQQSLIQFNNAQENVAGSTKEQINDLNDYINALEEKTSVDDKTIRQASQILAQDQIKIENQKKILAGIVDIAVANSKSNGGEIDTQGTATAIGRAMTTGDLGALTRQNIVGIDDATAKTFKLGTETERTAIMMKLLEDNGKGAGEALGNSLQGGLNRAKDKVEDLQVAVGSGLNAAFSVFSANLGDTLGGLKTNADGTNILGTGFVALASILSIVINTFKEMGLIIYSLGNSLVQAAKTTYAFGKDVIGIFGKVGDAISSIGEAMIKVVKGDFKGAKEAIKNGFDFSGSFDNTTKAMATADASYKKIEASIRKTSDSIDANVKQLFSAKTVYAETTKENNKLAEAKDAQAKATQKATQASEEEVKAMQTLRDKVLDLKNKTDELVQSLGEKLVDATTKFKESIKDIVTDGTKGLSDIVIKAETDIKDLKDKLAEEQAKSSDKQSADTIKQLNDEITKKQQILTSYGNFQSDLTKEIARVQAEADANNQLALTNTDPNKQASLDAKAQGLQLQIEALKGFSDLDKQVAEARKLAGDDEFKQAEINTFAKIQLATNAFIDETTKLREKQAVAIEVEKSVTDFYKTQTALRQKTLDAFATSSIATMKRIGDEAKTALSALNSLRSAGAQIDNPINPIDTPTITGSNASSSVSSNTTNNKNIVAPITVNATVKDTTDSTQIAKDLQWQLSHY